MQGLPVTLEETYHRILLKISPRHVERALVILQWLCAADNPWVIEEVVDHLAVDIATWQYNPARRHTDPRIILQSCGSLINKHWEVEFSHLSVKDFLLINSITLKDRPSFTLSFESANATVARLCIAYLLQLRDPKYLDAAPEAIEDIYMERPALKYVLRVWQRLVRRANHRDVDEFALQLFHSDSAFRAITTLYPCVHKHGHGHDVPKFIMLHSRLGKYLSGTFCRWRGC